MIRLPRLRHDDAEAVYGGGGGLPPKTIGVSIEYDRGKKQRLEFTTWCSFSKNPSSCDDPTYTAEYTDQYDTGLVSLATWALEFKFPWSDADQKRETITQKLEKRNGVKTVDVITEYEKLTSPGFEGDYWMVTTKIHITVTNPNTFASG